MLTDVILKCMGCCTKESPKGAGCAQDAPEGPQRMLVSREAAVERKRCAGVWMQEGGQVSPGWCGSED